MRKELHPLMRTMTVVMRNGASFQVETAMHRTTPYFLKTDKTMHPAWTGEKEGVSLEDARIARLLKKYEGFVETGLSEEK
jgi:ribosomal protein L31